MKPIVYLVNLVLVLLIARFEYNSGNDKSVIISSLAVTAIVVLNLIVGLLSQMDRKPFSHYYISAIGVIVLFFALLLVE
ncbi:MAG TPA: hypothetical protein VGD65_25085 [Chryseosolibacter sp.]